LGWVVIGCTTTYNHIWREPLKELWLQRVVDGDPTVEEEIAFVKVQVRKAGNCMVTIPGDVAEDLELKGGERVKVLYDKGKKKVVFQF
jgi:archaellum component FlaG (FlaF/FlaG flagellin family)